MSYAPERTNILGVGISEVTVDSTIVQIDSYLDNGQAAYVCVTGSHGVMESQHDEELRHIHNRANLVVPDGMPLVWLSRLHGKKNVSRVYGPDLMLAYLQHSIANKRRHFFYGGGEGVAEKLKDVLCEKYPGLQVVGTLCPPFSALTREEDENFIQQINETHPDVIWVGLSTPKQERWMADHLGQIDPSVMIGVGAAFDFNAGIKKKAPAWMQERGLEWFYRLLTEPGRLWRRYLWIVPMFIILNGLAFIGARRYSLDEK